jgi:hypothetical protein
MTAPNGHVAGYTSDGLDVSEKIKIAPCQELDPDHAASSLQSAFHEKVPAGAALLRFGREVNWWVD